MAFATQEMESEYYRIQKRTREDPGTAGDQGEENWAELLRHWLPQGYHVRTKGRILSDKKCREQAARRDSSQAKLP